MSWNYRVLKMADSDGTEIWSVHEVYYNEDGSVRTWTVNPVHPSGETWDELHRDSANYARAFLQPPLDITSGEAVELTITGRSQAVAKDGQRKRRPWQTKARAAGKQQRTRQTAAPPRKEER